VKVNKPYLQIVLYIADKIMIILNNMVKTMAVKNTGKNALKQRRGALTEEMNPHKGQGTAINICTNGSCRLRKAGCRGFEGCPGYKGN
jgi:hypothetical protein